MPEPSKVRRYATLTKWTSVVVIVVALFLLARVLPLETGVEKLKGWVDGFGMWGPVIFGLLYVAAVLLFVPGGALTIAAGAVFGFLGGVLTVSVASTVAAASAFLIARYLARSRISAMAERYPKFQAIDRAIADGGWKIVAMLRLVPLFPYSAGNYLFGLTSVGFWPYVLTSWVFMLPGTAMYVYVGFLGLTSLEAASEADSGVSFARIGLLVLAGAALVGVTVYLTKLAKRRLNEATELDTEEIESSEAAASAETAAEERQPEPARGGVVGAAIAAVLAAALLGFSIWAQMHQERFAGLFGPPVVQAKEAYDEGEGSADFDHSAFSDLLAKHVDAEGMVSYRGLRSEQGELDAYIDRIAAAPFEKLGRDEKLALLINAYNAFTLKLILEHYPVDSIRDIPAEQRWQAERFEVAGGTYSLDRIENELIRPKFEEPRIHFALVCAAVGCPKLRREAYVGDRLEQQLEDQAEYVHSHDRWFQFDVSAGVLKLTKLYQWYRHDFEQAAGSVLEYVARYSSTLREALEAGRDLKIEWLDYDWELNAQSA